ncbi:MAG: phosphomannomutase/phosphoglucomutase [Selenomonadales bacterium]|nr:phosphomannomutase/phosphoglucomutase [Selenomonadales bacterium]
MPINPQIFREYDIRGNAERDFAEPDLRRLTQAIVTYFESHGRREMLVAHDCRLSSPRIVATILDVARERGMRVVNIGMVTTPAFYYAAKHLGIDAGLIVTASHNPPPDNGMKVLLGPSTIHGAEIKQIERIAARLQPPAASHQPPTAGSNHLQATSDKPQATIHYDILTPYVAMLAEKIRLGPRRLKVVVDCGNGTAGPVTERFLEALGIDYIPLYFTPDGTFPNHEADPTKLKNLVDLRARVLAEKADLGIGFDGDGDRIGVVDDLGNVIWGDLLMALFWREILPKHPGTTCLVEVKCSQGLVDEIVRLGGRPEFTKTGHSLIKARMRELGAVFTGEMSGHIFFADEYYGFDDALYAAGRLLRLLSHSTDKLSSLIATLPTYYSTPETRIPCPDELKFGVVDELTQVLARQYATITVDGVRVQFPEGWGLFRASNTGPVIVTRCEGKTPALRQEYMRILDEALAKVLPGVAIPWEVGN